MAKQSNSLAEVVGYETYDVWLAMISELVPNGRTHRLAPLIAGMLQYAYRMADDQAEGSVACDLITAGEDLDYEVAWECLERATKQLFSDAGVQSERKNARGQGYSIAQQAVVEFVDWELMPWE